jgi:hypothetical protein
MGLMPACVYCLGTGELRDDQVLVRGAELYVCAPRGQVVEGYVVIAPYWCIGCLAALPGDWVDELTRLKQLVAEFYADAYGVACATFYEQGRAGGGASNETLIGFPLHAHLCGVPVALDMHAMLTGRYARQHVTGTHQLSEVAANDPYIYVESYGEQWVYLPRSDAERAELSTLRIKPELAAFIGRPERGHWRAYPGDDEVRRLIDRFTAFHTGTLA